MKNRLPVVCAFVLFVACEKQISVEFPYEGDRFFIFSEFESGKRFEVQVDRTYPPNDRILFDNAFLEGTEIYLYRDGVFLEKLRQGAEDRQVFFSAQGNKPFVGHGYQIRARAPGFPEAVSSQEVLLQPVEISSAWFEEKDVQSPLNPGVPAKVLNVSISGIPPDVPYLLFEILTFKDKDRTSANVISFEEYEELENPCMYNNASHRMFFKAECYNQQNATFRFYVEKLGSLQPPNYGQADVNRLEIKLSSVNKSYFDYYYRKTGPLDFFTAFEGQNPTYSTFENGYGAVLTKNTVFETVKLQ